MRREQKVEDYLLEQVEARGGLCGKHTSPGRRGAPDRLLTWHGGVMHLVETKAKDGRIRPEQGRDHLRRGKLGVHVFVLWSKEAVDDYLNRARFFYGCR